jgi:hypothetical protein
MGGLADVVSALPRVLARLGHKVSVFIPYYRQVAKAVPNPPVVLSSVTIPFPSYNRFVRVLNGGVDAGVQTYFIDCPELFDRESLYGTPSGDYPDNAERFGLFSRAVIEASKVIEVPDVFHVHDWQAAMLAVLLRSTYYFDPVFRHVPAVLTIHNAGYQGWFPPQTMEKLLLPWDMFTFDKLDTTTDEFSKAALCTRTPSPPSAASTPRRSRRPSLPTVSRVSCGSAAAISSASSTASTTRSGTRPPIRISLRTIPQKTLQARRNAGATCCMPLDLRASATKPL